MSTETTLERIEAFLMAETQIILGSKDRSVDASMTLADMGFDSMSFISLLISIEKKYNVQLIGNGLMPENMNTLHSLARLIFSRAT